MASQLLPRTAGVRAVPPWSRSQDVAVRQERGNEKIAKLSHKSFFTTAHAAIGAYLQGIYME